jgi:hypothetical protein
MWEFPEEMVFEDNFRFAENPYFIRPNHLKRLVLLKIWRAKRYCSYLPTGTFRRTSSKKFSRRITTFGPGSDDCPVVLAWINGETR